MTMPYKLLLYIAIWAPAAVAIAESPIAPGARPVQLSETGAGEGPAWRDGWLYFSGGGKINRWRPGGAGVEVYREQSGGSNGLQFDAQGRLIVCESMTRRVTRT